MDTVLNILGFIFFWVVGLFIWNLSYKKKNWFK